MSRFKIVYVVNAGIPPYDLVITKAVRYLTAHDRSDALDKAAEAWDVADGELVNWYAFPAERRASQQEE